MRESRLIRHRTSTACTVEAGHAEPAGDLDRAEPLAPPQPHDLAHHLRLVLVGLWCGRELRSIIPAAPSARYRSAHFFAVRAATMNIFAAAA